MSRDYLAQVIRETAEISQQSARLCVAEMVDAIIEALREQGSFSLTGFGTFTVRRTKARIGRNPRTGEKIKIRAGKQIRFRASPTLRQSL